VFAHQRKRVQLLFAMADAVLTAIAFEAAYHTRTQLALDRIFFLHGRTHVLLIVLSVVVWVALGSQQRVYEYLDSASTRRLLAHTFRQCLLGTVLVILIQYLMRLDPPLSRSFLSLLFLYDLALLALFRWQSPRLVGAFHREFGSPYHIVLVGSRAKTAKLETQLSEGSPFRIQISAILTEEECAREIPKLLARQVVDEVIFSVESGTLSELEAVFLRCDEEGVRTRVAIDFFPHVNSDITLDRVGEAPLLTFSAAPVDEFSLLVKRLIDIVASVSAMVLFAPVFFFIAVLIKLTSPGPVIYRQSRCGLNGRRFTMYKFRSMVHNAEDLRAELEHLNERQIAFKLARDPRVTSVGRFIRKYSIDEWPQFWNVFRGDMSLVGPRPPVPSEVERYERWQKRRLRMRPGLTCLWAVMGRDHLDFNAWMRTDISYIDNWSLKLDWSILLKTIPHVLAGKGAH
jgi:exopolysaccharide biosynthesis polyprenyl glycosylphosphotransferase